MKKNLALILALVMVLALCACGAKGGDTSEEAYKAYLKEFVRAIPAFNEETIGNLEAGIDAGEYDAPPSNMIFSDQFFGHAAMSYDEFVAAGGEYTIPEFDPDLKADDGSASGEPSVESGGETQ